MKRTAPIPCLNRAAVLLGFIDRSTPIPTISMSSVSPHVPTGNASVSRPTSYAAVPHPAILHALQSVPTEHSRSPIRIGSHDRRLLAPCSGSRAPSAGAASSALAPHARSCCRPSIASSGCRLSTGTVPRYAELGPRGDRRDCRTPRTLSPARSHDRSDPRKLPTTSRCADSRNDLGAGCRGRMGRRRRTFTRFEAYVARFEPPVHELSLRLSQHQPKASGLSSVMSRDAKAISIL